MNLYIHVPFCAQRCGYCDFYTQTKLGLRVAYIEALLRELEGRRGELPEGEAIEHIYLGGGTPSLLALQDLERIFEHLYALYPTKAGSEVTLEANPDDITPEYAEGLARLPINRVSMGVQSFQEGELQRLNRRHTAQQAIDAVRHLRSVGISELSLDLIYGLPNQTLGAWQDNIAQTLALGVPHISAYHLIYEEGTPLTRAMLRGRVRPVTEELSLDMLRLLIEQLEAAGYQHYEISNFARPDHHARLNTGYWQGVHYLGFGPSAHSYDGRSRSHNVASIEDYTKGWAHGERIATTEVLGDVDRHNEYLMTRLRTMWGIELEDMARTCGMVAAERLKSLAIPYIEEGKLSLTGGRLRLTRSGLFISDAILVELFL